VVDVLDALREVQIELLVRLGGQGQACALRRRTAPTMYGEIVAIGASACTTMPEAADDEAADDEAARADAPIRSTCSSAMARWS
jgi:hypothetical protein